MRRPVLSASLLQQAFAHYARNLSRASLLGGWSPRVRARILLVALALSAFGLEGCARSPAPAEQLESGAQGIMGGAETQTCEWPAVVALGGCSGTLVHPRLVVYAAHCGLTMTEVRFGTDASAPVGVAEVSQCRAFPDAQLGDGSDVAYCVLREPVLDVPPARILAGCELDALSAGTAAHIVGFGVDITGGQFGTQRAASARIARVASGEFFLDSSESDTCRGDSGGPVFVEIGAADGPTELRLAGVTSAGSSRECGQGVGHYVNLAAKMAWIESSSGFDVSPCFEGDVWKPTPACSAVLDARVRGEQDPVDGAVCQLPAGAELSSTCGEAFALPADDEPPSIELTGIDDVLVHHLAAGQRYLAIELALRVEDEDWGVEQVGISLLGDDGTPLFERSDEVAPYGIEELRIPPGTFELLVEARDHAGNSAARAVQLRVVPAASEGPSCSVGQPRSKSGPGVWLLVGLGLVVLSRRARSSLELRCQVWKRGSTTSKRVPRPTSDSTSTCPPALRTME
jgi:MYXO-CTERM domain-containing protein